MTLSRTFVNLISVQLTLSWTCNYGPTVKVAIYKQGIRLVLVFKMCLLLHFAAFILVQDVYHVSLSRIFMQNFDLDPTSGFIDWY